ncbi:hypothetical protein CDV55_109075 [Aspergillus turcosus]|uniref:Uncharacterized protein n=1 Tax=Aspergillus turcosus TaxID=1245748 RepID=A0A229X8U3_9EURO|nr:hypothetical protein CDV55_109075 [Aspergillus turcosus]RLM00864.1 hypothetical protein CFD26_104877 [Aspergillus turcosus]
MENPYKELRLAIEIGDISKVAELLDDSTLMTVEHFVIATKIKRYDVLELFLSHGWDINTDVNDIVPSTLVYTFEDSNLLDWFLNHGADPNKRCRNRDCTPLSYAVRDAPFDVIKILFEKGGQLQHGQLLHYAAMRTRDDGREVLQFIYDKDPEFNKLRIDNLLDERSPEYLMNERNGLCTPLHYAAISGSVDMVNFLRGKGAACDILDPYRRTPLGYAVYNGHYEVERILKGRADLDRGLEQHI